MMNLAWHEKAWDDYIYWQTQDKKTLKRVNMLIKDILRDPYNLDGLGKPEVLTEDLSGYYSRRIDGSNRIVYKARGEFVIIYSCRGHYN